MWPQNLMFFLFPALVIILIYFLLPVLGKKKEPFGYKTDQPLSEPEFNKVKKVYYRKVFLFSIPLTIALSVINMYILSTFLGSFLLGAFILSLGAVNFLFYMQAFRSVREFFNNTPISADSDSDEVNETEESEKLPKW